MLRFCGHILAIVLIAVIGSVPALAQGSGGDCGDVGRLSPIIYGRFLDESVVKACTAIISNASANEEARWVAYRLRAEALRDLRKTEAALRDFEQALRRKPDDSWTFLERGRAYMDLGLFEKAIKDFRRSRLLIAEGFIGLALARKGDFREAIEVTESYLEKCGCDASFANDALVRARHGLAALGMRGQKINAKARHVALLIGNSAYTGGIGRLPNAENDVRDLALVLRANGYTVFGPHLNLKRAEMLAAIAEFQGAAAKAESAVVWYAGHAFEFELAPAQSGNWLVPIGFGMQNDVMRDAVPLSQLLESVLPARSFRAVIVDACRASGTRSTEIVGRGLRVVGKVVRGLGFEERADMLIVYSTRAGRIALDGRGRNSPFAEAFLGEIKADPKQLALELLAGVTGRVIELTSSYQPPQQPEIISRLTRKGMRFVP